MKVRIINAYRKQSEHSLVTLGLRVVEKMENNPVFPDPPASLAALKSILPEFSAALVQAIGRDKLTVSTKNDKKAVLLSQLVSLEQYVTATCKGDRSLLLSSGFDVTEEEPGRRLTIGKIDVELGGPGEATIRVRNVTGAIAYMHQYTSEKPGPDTLWFSAGSSYRYYKFTGLQSDKRYWLRVVAIGYGGKTVVSEVVSRVIQ